MTTLSDPHYQVEAVSMLLRKSLRNLSDINFDLSEILEAELSKNDIFNIV